MCASCALTFGLGVTWIRKQEKQQNGKRVSKLRNLNVITQSHVAWIKPSVLFSPLFKLIIDGLWQTQDSH